MSSNLLIHLPSGKRLVWYLAAEEYFAKNIQPLQQGFGKGSEVTAAFLIKISHICFCLIVTTNFTFAITIAI